LKFLKLADNADLVESANDCIEELTGSCDLCEGIGTENYEYQDIIDDKRFKRLYAALIYLEWLDNYGGGKPTAAGFSTSNGDSFSDFSIQSGSQIKDKYKRQQSKVASLTKKFKVLMSESGCVECEEVSKCGCSSNCGCSEKKLPSIYSSSNQAFL